ncbi:MAG: ribonuclease H-like domain-containing protein [Chloroflexota bacterium]
MRTHKHLPLNMLNGIQRKTIADMHRSGVRSLQQIVSMSPDELQQFYGIKSTAHRFHAQARAWVHDEAVRYADLSPVCLRDAWYFDIETVVGTPEEGQVWSIGYSKGDSKTSAIMVDAAMHAPKHTLAHGHHIHYVPDYTAAWELFALIANTDDEPLFHWSGYDAGNMRTWAPGVYEQLKPRLFDLSRIFSRTVQIPRRGVSLKVVAPYLGFEWQAYDDWFFAWQDYRHWLRSRDETRLVQLSHYQADDVLAMIVIRDWLVGL